MPETLKHESRDLLAAKLAEQAVAAAVKVESTELRWDPDGADISGDFF